MRIYILNLLLILCCISVLLSIHPPACSEGNTPLKVAIYRREFRIVALLRNVGTSQQELFRATACHEQHSIELVANDTGANHVIESQKSSIRISLMVSAKYFGGRENDGCMPCH